MCLRLCGRACSVALDVRIVDMRAIDKIWGFVSADSPQQRVLITFISNIAKSGFGFLTALILARGFGPAKYGEYSFILATFSAVAYLIDVGGASAFYSHISRRLRGKEFYLIYAAWMAVQFMLTSLILLVLAPANVLQTLLMSGERLTLFMAFCAVFAQQQCINALTMILESDRKTIKSQTILLVGSMYYMATMFVYSQVAHLSMNMAFAIMLSQQLLVGLLLCKFGWVVVSRSMTVAESWVECWREYWVYCRPLIPGAVFAFLYSYSDRWLLQRFAGSVEQGYFQVSMQFSVIAMVFTTSILRVFAKELAAAVGEGDKDGLVRIYRYAYVMTVLVVSFVAGMIAPWADEIIWLALGGSYAGAANVFIVLLIYPVYQSLGQIAGTFLMSVGQTALHSVVSISVIIASLPLGFVLLAPGELYGFNMGSLGLALKLCLISFMSVNFLNFALAKKNGFKVDYYSQLAIPIFLGIGFLSKHIVSLCFEGVTQFTGSVFVNAALATLLYGTCACVFFVAVRSSSGASILLARVLSR